MKKKISRVTAFLLVMALMVPFLSGCGQTAQSKKVVFKVDGEDVCLDEVWFYCKSVQEYYEQYYSSMFSTPEAWTSSYPVEKDDGTTEDSTLENVAKRSAIKQIRQIKIAVAKADKKGIKLSESEKENVETQAKNFMEGVTKDEKKKMGITKELAERIFTESAKVQKYKEQLAKDEGIEISDEDAQTSKIYYIQFPTTVYDASGNAATASDENKEQAKNDAEDALKRIQAGNDIATVAAAYGMTGSSGEVNVDPETELPEEISKAIADLTDGQTYDKVVEASDGFYILQMVSVIDEQATADKKSDLLEQKEQDLLNKKYEKWTKDDKFDFDKDVDWELLKTIDFVAASTVTTQAATEASEAEKTDAAATTEAATQAETTEAK